MKRWTDMDTPGINMSLCVLLQLLQFRKAGCFAILHVPAVEPKARLPLANLDQGWRGSAPGASSGKTS